MKMKKFLIHLGLFIVLICCIGAISAASDDIMNETLSEIDYGENSISLENDELTVDGDTYSLLTAQEREPNMLGKSIEFYGDSFNALQNCIATAGDGDTINLNNDIKYEGSGVENLNVWRDLTINGNGHSIDGNGAPIIQVNTGQAILKNIKFINGYGKEKSPVSWWTGEGGIYNCEFINCNSDFWGGAIHWGAENGNVVDCSFKNCHCSNTTGGAIHCADGAKYSKIKL